MMMGFFSLNTTAHKVRQMLLPMKWARKGIRRRSTKNSLLYRDTVSVSVAGELLPNAYSTKIFVAHADQKLQQEFIPSAKPGV